MPLSQLKYSGGGGGGRSVLGGALGGSSVYVVFNATKIRLCILKSKQQLQLQLQLVK